MSAEARAARTVGVKQFEGMNFIAKIGVEMGGPRKDSSGNYPDKNILAGVITKDKPGWHAVEQPPPFNGGGGGDQAQRFTKQAITRSRSPRSRLDLR